MVFTGTYEHAIDGKNRLAIPSEIRRHLVHAATKDTSPDTPVFLYVSLGEGGSLAIYEEKTFEKRAEQLDSSEMDPEQLLAYERLMYSLSARVELDPQGRVRLPDNLIKIAKLGTEVVLIGVKDHLEIRDRASWQSHVEQTLANDPNAMVNPRRFIGHRGNGSGNGNGDGKSH